jgi:hypothetical protein
MHSSNLLAVLLVSTSAQAMSFPAEFSLSSLPLKNAFGRRQAPAAPAAAPVPAAAPPAAAIPAASPASGVRYAYFNVQSQKLT